MAIADAIKKVPTPVWLGLGGAGLGLGYVYLRDKSAPPPAEPPAGSEFTPISDTAGYSTDGYAPNPVYASPAYPDSGTTVGAVGQTGLETIGGFFTEFIGILPDLVESLKPNYDGIPQAQGPGTPTIAQPATQPAPVAGSPAPAANKPNGYHAGGQVRNTSGSVKRNFSGASGWTEIPTPDARFADFHVAFPSGVLQRWRGWGTGGHVPTAKRGDWDKIWEGKWR